MKYKVVWGAALAHIRMWPIIPWIQTDGYGWYFSWLFIRVFRYTAPCEG